RAPRNRLETRLTLVQRAIVAVAVFLFVAIMLLPMWNVLVLSTSTALDASASGLKLWWNGRFTFEGYKYVFEVSKLGIPFLISLYVTTVGTVIQVVLSALAGYVLIQRGLPGKRFITSFIMLTMMIPGDLTLISIYQVNKQFSLLNSYTGLIVNGLISGFSILLIRNYFLSVPVSLAESARLDGASELRIFAGMYLPISMPGVATIFFIEFVAKWNSITIPATIITDQSKFTLPLMLRSMILQNNVSMSGGMVVPPNAIMAAVVISTVPLLLIYIFAQRFLLSGMTLGATKE
ncbi:MAG: carbohydrate ABC transporter permease, partial [Oscillospiraceae bacterium]